MTEGELILYTDEDGTIWITQAEMSSLFQTTPQNITLRDKAIYSEGELLPEVTCLEFGELQALNRRAMYMDDWIAKLDDFLRISEREVLDHAGSISHEQALQKAQAEYEKYRKQLVNEANPVERHFEEAVKKLKLLDREKPKLTGKGVQKK